MTLYLLVWKTTFFSSRMYVNVMSCTSFSTRQTETLPLRAGRAVEAVGGSSPLKEFLGLPQAQQQKQDLGWATSSTSSSREPQGRTKHVQSSRSSLLSELLGLGEEMEGYVGSWISTYMFNATSIIPEPLWWKPEDYLLEGKLII